MVFSEEFYEDFFVECKEGYIEDLASIQLEYNKLKYLGDFKFYSYNDKWFRYLRDKVLGKELYEQIMSDLMEKKSFEPKSVIHDLWLTNEQLTHLSKDGHMLGLHSYSHPMQMKELSYQEQSMEFSKNLEHLSSIVEGDSIISMSHPCGSYSQETLEILKGLGIKVGFRSNMAVDKINTLLEIPREDHSNILKKMGSCA